jgi:hypothetical protein
VLNLKKVGAEKEQQAIGARGESLPEDHVRGETRPADTARESARPKQGVLSAEEHAQEEPESLRAARVHADPQVSLFCQLTLRMLCFSKINLFSCNYFYLIAQNGISGKKCWANFSKKYFSIKN